MLFKYLFVALEVRHVLLSDTMLVTDACHWYTSLHLISDFHFILNRPANMVLWRNKKENYDTCDVMSLQLKNSTKTA